MRVETKRSFARDYEDRLVEAEVDSVITTFEYRGDGLRDSATVGMNTTTYTWDIAAGLPVVLQENSVRYIWGAHGLIAQVDATPDWHYYHADGLGSTLAITDAVGAVEQTYEYDVYGAVTGGSGTLDNSFQFAGEQVDAGTGLQYLRARYYDTEVGRFVSRDPLTHQPGYRGSAYSYGAASPANMRDPLGLCSWWLLDCIDDAASAAWSGITGAADALNGAIAGTADDVKNAVVGFAVSMDTVLADLKADIAQLPQNLADKLGPIVNHFIGDVFRLVEKAQALARGCNANKTDCVGAFAVITLGYLSALSMTAAAGAVCAGSGGFACALLVPGVYSANTVRKQTTEAAIDLILKNDPQRGR